MAVDRDDDKEKAEGSRETVDEALRQREGEEPGARQGVTNRPRSEEERQQEHLPPRGHRKAEDEGREPDLEHKTDWEGRAHGE